MTSEKKCKEKGDGIVFVKRDATEPKISSFKRILGLRMIFRFLEVDETSTPLCNLNFTSKTSSCC